MKINREIEYESRDAGGWSWLWPGTNHSDPIIVFCWALLKFTRKSCVAFVHIQDQFCHFSSSRHGNCTFCCNVVFLVPIFHIYRCL